MSILTKPSNPLSAATEYGFELSIPELLQLVQSVTNSDYWEDISNWREVDFVYVNAQKQYQRIVFDLASNEVEVDYAFNENCINGLFECGRITVFGYVNDSLRIKRPAYGAEFDVIIVDGIELGTSIVINSVTPPMFGTYVENDVLTFTLNFSDLVNITGLSLLNEDGTLVLLEDEYALLLEDTRLAILVGSEIRYATYVSGSESANVVYEYVVQAGDQDLDGIEILSLDLNGGVIIGVNGESVNITIPTTDTSGVLIDNSAPDIIAPTITDILVSDGIYEDQDDIIFTVEFSENVLVSGSPVLTLDIGGVTRQAALLSSSLNQAVFSYTVEQPDNDNNGIEILSLDNGVITDAALNPLDRTLPVVDTSNVFVSTDIIAPTILSITAVDGNYKTGDNLNFTATFSEPVVITGTPYLLVDIGGTQVQANMTSNNSADATFSYTVLAGQLDTDGVQVLSLDSAVITDNALNLLDRTLPSMDMSLVKVDAVSPSITSISAPADDNYATGEVISFVANFTENVVVTGTPFLQVLIGSSVKQFDYVVGGSGTNALTFSYTVLSTDLDEDGISFSSTDIQIPSATIKDAAGNNAVLSFTAPTTTGITVNANIIELSQTFSSSVYESSYALTSKSLFIQPYNTSDVNYYKINESGEFIFQYSFTVTGASKISASETHLAVSSFNSFIPSLNFIRVYNLDINGAPTSLVSYTTISSPNGIVLLGIWDKAVIAQIINYSQTSIMGYYVYPININGTVSTTHTQFIQQDFGNLLTKMTRDSLFTYRSGYYVPPSGPQVDGIIYVRKLNQITSTLYLDQTITPTSYLQWNQFAVDVNNSSNILAIGIQPPNNTTQRIGYALFNEANTSGAPFAELPSDFFFSVSDVAFIGFSNNDMFTLEYPNGYVDETQQNLVYRAYTNIPSIGSPTTLQTITSGYTRILAVSDTHLLVGNYDDSNLTIGTVYVYKI